MLIEFIQIINRRRQTLISLPLPSAEQNNMQNVVKLISLLIQPIKHSLRNPTIVITQFILASRT